MLQAGYLEDWEWNATLSGCPQAAWYLPSCPIFTLTGWTNSSRQFSSPNTPGRIQEAQTCIRQVRMRAGAPEARRPPETASALRKRLRGLPSGDPRIPASGGCITPLRRRHLLGFTGPRAEAEQIKAPPGGSSCGTNSSWNFAGEDLDHPRQHGAARFLGYEITVHHTTESRRTPLGQWRHQPACPPVGDQGQVRPLLQARQTRAPPRTDEPGRPRSSAPTDRSIGASSSTTCWPVMSGGSPGCVGHGDLHAEDAGAQAPLVGNEDGPQVQGHYRHAARAAQCFEARVERASKKPLVARFGGIPLRQHRGGPH